MAIIHQATLTPTKLELLAAWLPTRDWYDGLAAVERVAACRFDDPAGAVGLETFVVRAGAGPLVHVPMTYRAAPLDEAEPWLIGTTEHSVLGTRWVYDACADPVYVAELAKVIRTGGHEADEYVETAGGPARREPLMSVRGSGTRAPGSAATIVRVDDGDPAVVLTTLGELSVRRVLTTTPAYAELTLAGSWPAHPGPVVLAVLS